MCSQAGSPLRSRVPRRRRPASRDFGARQGIDPLVPLVPGMALDPVPVDAVALVQTLQAPPQIDVLDSPAVAPAPVLGAPPRQPRCDPLPDVLRVRVEVDRARFGQIGEGRDRRLELHAVVRGARSTAHELPRAPAGVEDHRRPASRARVGAGAAIGVDDKGLPGGRLGAHDGVNVAVRRAPEGG